jgi:asparagine synthase (glutamine-hydrolysing)
VRDRVGIKPLYYACPGSSGAGRDAGEPQAGCLRSIAFASEVKSILASGLIKAELDREALHQFLTFLWVPDPNTLFAGVKTVPPGHVVTWRNNQLTVREWWDISFDSIEEGRSEAWWQEQVLETLDRVVKLEMVADVPLGSFLSGGIDSSTIVAMMKRHSDGRRIGTYTIGIEAEDLRYDIIPDDVEWARRVNQQLDTDYHEIMLQPDVAELLPKLVYHMDEPAIDMAIPSYLVSRAARETLTVMLSGMGGDEVFAGYPRQMAMKLAGAFDPVPQMLRRPVMKALAHALPGGMPGKLTAPLRNAKKFARSAALDFENRYLGYGTYFTDEAKARLYSEEMRGTTRDLDAYGAHRGYFARVKDAAPLNQMLYVDLKTFLPCLNLMTTDKTSMAANLEVRVPFLNQEILNLTARMPPD